MITFALDTSAESVSLVLAVNGEVIAEENFIASFELSAILLEKIDSLLKAAKVKLKEIETIAAVCGPGKFTGIRVGLTALKGLFFDKQVKIVPLISNEVVAFQARNWPGKIVSLINALRGELYFAVYHFQNNQLCSLLEPQIVRPEGLSLKLENYPQINFIGNGAVIYHEIIANQFPSAKFIEFNPFVGREAVRLANERVLQGKYIADFSGLLPFYLRPPDAEIKKS